MLEKSRKEVHRLDHSFRDFYKVPFKLLSSCGVKLIYWSPDDRMTTAEKFGLGLMIFNIITSCCWMMLYLLQGKLKTALDCTTLAIYWLFVLNSISKLGTLLIGRRAFEKMARNMQSTFPITPEERDYYGIEAHYKEIRFGGMFLMCFHLLTTSMFNAFPIVQSVVEYKLGNSTDKQFGYLLPYMMAYPFNVEQPINYAIVYVLQSIAAYNASLVFIGSDLILIVTVRIINMKFKYLMNRVRDFKPTKTEKDIIELGKLLEFHNDILNYCIEIDNMFNLSIFMNYFATGMIICLLGIQVVIGSELLNLAKFTSFLVSSFMHMYMISAAGHDMTILSLDVSDAFFHHRWYEANVNYQRMLPLALARSQRQAQLNAFKFFVISMESLKTLLTTSYQFFALINTQLSS